MISATRGGTIHHTDPRILPEQLGSPIFRQRHRLKYAYLAGAMYKGIASKELVIAMGKASLLGFLGTGGLKFDRIERRVVGPEHRLELVLESLVLVLEEVEAALELLEFVTFGAHAV